MVYSDGAHRAFGQRADIAAVDKIARACPGRGAMTLLTNMLNLCLTWALALLFVLACAVVW